MTHKIFTTDTELQRQEAHLRESDGDLQQEAALTLNNKNANQQPRTPPIVPHVAPTATKDPKPFTFVPLKMGGSGRTHVVSEASKRLVEEEVTLEDLQKMTTLFYDKAFEDKTLDQFIRSHKDPHADRFAKWIHQKLSGSTVWDEERRDRSQKPVTLAHGHRHVVHDRSSAHAAAWYSPKRPSEEVGRHFKLDECRVWMRLHFWALRESGLLERSPSFSDYYVRFIGHFVNVYESSAPSFARESFRWSASAKNIQKYLDNGREMKDVLGLSLRQSLKQLPPDEAEDDVWPYNTKA